MVTIDYKDNKGRMRRKIFATNNIDMISNFLKANPDIEIIRRFEDYKPTSMRYSINYK